MTDLIDMHVHSTCSDGTLTPGALVAYAKEKGLKAMVLSDHDTTDGIDEAMAAGKLYGVEIIPGIEFSTSYAGKDIHILGLGIRWQEEGFISRLKEFQDTRDLRNRKMIDKLREYGVDITYEKMNVAFPDSVWTRANFARYLLDGHYVKSMADAFTRYVGDNAPCFVPREKVTPFQALELIREGGGYSVLAHPLHYRMKPDALEELVSRLKEAGLDGIEAIYSTHRGLDESHVKGLARKYGLCITGGSDFHGTNKPDIDLAVGRGNLKIPYSLWTKLQNHEAYI